MTARIVWFTDAEGRWDKLADALAGAPGVALRGDRIDLDDGVTLVFGGDAVDRGPGGRRVVRALLDARRRHGPERVVLLAGNRDLNKLRLHRELAGAPHPRAPEAVRGDPPALLRWIFSTTMGAGDAFAHRAAELAAEGLPAADDDVVESFRADVAPGGLTRAYLRASRLAFRAGDALFVHGAVTAASLGVVPGRARVEGVDAWVDALNAFLADERDRFEETGDAPALIAYQAPVPGTRENRASVVYGRLADADNDPRLPEPEVVDALLRAGVRRLAVGHTPAGDAPVLLRDRGFTLFVADTSYGRLERGARVVFDADGAEVSGAARLDDGATVAISARLGDRDPAGRVTAEGRLLTAPVGGAWLQFRALPGRRVEQRVGPADGPLRAAFPVGS